MTTTIENSASPIIFDSRAQTSLTERHPATLTPEDREKLLLENLSEVRFIARQIHRGLPPHVPFDDLVHEGVVGLIDAVRKFDPRKNVRLRAYARFRIRGAILDSLRGLDWGPRHLRREARRIEQARNELAFRLGRVPSEPELAAQLCVPLKELQHLLTEIHCLSLDTPQTSCEPISKQEAFGDRPDWAQEDAFDRCSRAEKTRSLRKAIANLAPKAQRALTLYYFEECTMKEVGKVLNVQEARVSQIISKALDQLRILLQNDQEGRVE